MALVTRFRRSEISLAAKEGVIQVGAVLLALPWLLKISVILAGVWVAQAFDSQRLARWGGDFPADWLSTWGQLGLGVLAVAVGGWLMRRSPGGLGDELGSALIVLGAWNAVSL